MNKTVKYFSFITVAMCYCFSVLAQGPKADSLKSLLEKDKEDTAKINHLNALGWELKNSNPDSCISLSTQALLLAEKLNASSSGHLLTTAKKGMAASLGNLGVCYRLKGNYAKALDLFLRALKIDEQLADKQGMASRFANIGSVYWNQADNSRALDYYLKALKINKDLANKKGIANNLGNIGSVYCKQAEELRLRGDTVRAGKGYQKTLEYYLEALKLSEEIGYKQMQANTLGNIGMVYQEQALMSRISLQKKEVLFSTGLAYLFKALKISEEIRNNNSIAFQLGNIGSLYTEAPYLPAAAGEKKTGFTLAAKYLYRALVISDSLGTLDNVKDWYLQLSALYERSTIPLPDSTGTKLLTKEEMRTLALHYFKRYLNLRDAIFSAENKKELVRMEMNFIFDKKEIAAKAEQEKKDATSKIILWSVIAGLALLAGFVGFIFRSLRVIRKQKKIIEIKVKHTEEQKKIIEEKHKIAIQELETFIYKASHDLKGPLSSILGLMQITKSEIKDKTSIQYFNMIDEMTHKLDDMLLELIKSMRIKDTEQFTDEIDFQKTTIGATNKFQYVKGSERIKIYTDISLSAPFYSSKFIIDTVFQNIIGNSIKYQSHEQVESFLKISVTREKDLLKILFEDNGIGIEDSIQEKIFNMYYRGSERSKGSGLGLYLVKKGIEKLNGEIKVSSTLGKGTVFTILLKAK